MHNRIVVNRKTAPPCLLRGGAVFLGYSVCSAYPVDQREMAQLIHSTRIGKSDTASAEKADGKPCFLHFNITSVAGELLLYIIH